MTKMWCLLSFLLLVVLGEFQLSQGNPAAKESTPKGACYMCEGYEACSKDLDTMKTESNVNWLDTLRGADVPQCLTGYNLTGPGGPKVFARGPFYMNSKKVHEPYCACKDSTCKEEVCFCYESLCNGRDPECKFRANATLVPGCTA